MSGAHHSLIPRMGLMHLGLLGMALAVLGCGGTESKTEQRCMELEPEEQTIYLREVFFDPYRFFDIGWFAGASHLAGGDKIVQFRLFEGHVADDGDLSLPQGYAFSNLLDAANSPDSVAHRWRELDSSTEYKLEPDHHFLFFRGPRSEVPTASLAYWMVVQRIDGTRDTLGQTSPGTGYRLQLLKPENPSPDDGLWEASWRNVYDIPIRDDELYAADMGIYKGEPGDEENPANPNSQSGVPFLQVLGLDSTGPSGGPPPDGYVDHQRLIAYADAGLLIFPDRHPFASESLVEPVPEIYRQANPVVLPELSRYYLRVNYRQRPRVFPLGAYQIVKGSLILTINGQRLTEGVQFQINCPGQELQFIDDNLLDPNARVEVCFEYVR